MSKFQMGSHIFKKAGITPTLGLIWVFMFGWHNNPRPGRCPAEAKPGHIMKWRRRRGPKAKRGRCGVNGAARVTKNKIGRWVRKGIMPKPGATFLKEAANEPQ